MKPKRIERKLTVHRENKKTYTVKIHLDPDQALWLKAYARAGGLEPGAEGGLLRLWAVQGLEDRIEDQAAPDEPGPDWSAE